MACLQHKHKREDNVSRYATSEDFCKVFHEELDGLYQLSFLMTGDHETAERCFLAGLEDCYQANHVLKSWALTWAKRTIIRNAIRELRPRPHRDRWSSAEPVFRYGGEPSKIRGVRFKTEGVLALDDFERFVFVISVLEQYSDRDCTVLLGCSLPEVWYARVESILHIANSGQTAARRSDEEVAAAIGSSEKTLPGFHGSALFAIN